MTTCCIGDNANLRAGVLAEGEAQDLQAMAEAELVECPVCGGEGSTLFVVIRYLCEWCDGTGRCTRATATAWEGIGR